MPGMFASTLWDRRLQLFTLLILFILTLIFLTPTTSSLIPSSALAALSTASPPSHDWLVATISPALAQRRRNMIRTTWQALYTGPPATFRFVIANPGEEWFPVLLDEQDKYGDLIMLDHLTESKELGMKTKEIDFALWLVEQGTPWRYVSKLDDDSYLDASAFYEEYLSPRLNDTTIKPEDEDPVIIGRHMGRDGFISLEFPFPYPGGQFWTMSWPVVTALAHQYNISSTRHEFADVLVGMLLDEAGKEFEFVDMPHSEAFELFRGRMDEERWEHDITSKSMNPHLLKDDDVWLKVSEEMKSVSKGRKWWKDEDRWDWNADDKSGLKGSRARRRRRGV
jgi:hypothetical protein